MRHRRAAGHAHASAIPAGADLAASSPVTKGVSSRASDELLLLLHRAFKVANDPRSIAVRSGRRRACPSTMTGAVRPARGLTGQGLHRGPRGADRASGHAYRGGPRGSFPDGAELALLKTLGGRDGTGRSFRHFERAM